MIMNKIQKFNASKLTKESYKEFKKIYDATSQDSFKKTNIRAVDMNASYMVKFMDFMEEADKQCKKFEQLARKIDEAKYHIQK